jgi:phospholipase C
MRGIERRQFLQGVGAFVASGLAPSLATAALGLPAKLTDIDHIIVLMKENRSFDHYFGTLRGVRGFNDPAGERIFRQADAQNPRGYELPFHLDTLRTSAQKLHVLSHEWGAQHASWNGGRMDNWLPAHRAADGTYGLADAFTICDGYHCSVLGPTHPNRFYLMSATIDPESRYGNPAITNAGKAYRWETYPERLERAKISWRIYHDTDDYNCNVCKYFTQFQSLATNSPLYDAAIRDRPLSELLRDLQTGNIPQVTWIVPPSTVSEHPDYMPAAGEDHTSRVLAALWSNPALWAKTALILNYDENDGQFDHVTPPTAPPGTPGEFVGGQPVGLGFRVPCLVISPFSRGGYVCGATFDHTSTLRLIETRFGVEVGNLSKWRRETCGDLTAAFGFGAPARLEVPNLPETEQALRAAQQRAMSEPLPEVPAEQAMPRQEPGSRPRRA